MLRLQVIIGIKWFVLSFVITQSQGKKMIAINELDKNAHWPTMQTQQPQNQGIKPMRWEKTELLLKRVNDGGYSGQFLADAFLSAYRSGVPFNHSLGCLLNLDAEAFELFHEILHLHLNPWDNDGLYQIEQEIKALQSKN